MGFDKIDGDLAGAARSVVISGTSEEYIAGLKTLIARKPSRDAT